MLTQLCVLLTLRPAPMPCTLLLLQVVEELEAAYGPPHLLGSLQATLSEGTIVLSRGTSSAEREQGMARELPELAVVGPKAAPLPLELLRRVSLSLPAPLEQPALAAAAAAGGAAPHAGGEGGGGARPALPSRATSMTQQSPFFSAPTQREEGQQHRGEEQQQRHRDGRATSAFGQQLTVEELASSIPSPSHGTRRAPSLRRWDPSVLAARVAGRAFPLHPAFSITNDSPFAARADGATHAPPLHPAYSITNDSPFASRSGAASPPPAPLPPPTPPAGLPVSPMHEPSSAGGDERHAQGDQVEEEEEGEGGEEEAQAAAAHCDGGGHEPPSSQGVLEFQALANAQSSAPSIDAEVAASLRSTLRLAPHTGEGCTGTAVGDAAAASDDAWVAAAAGVPPALQQQQQLQEPGPHRTTHTPSVSVDP